MNNWLATTKPRRALDLQIVQEFRAKLKATEDMMGKLAYNLREIGAGWRSKSESLAKQTGLKTLSRWVAPSTNVEKSR